MDHHTQQCPAYFGSKTCSGEPLCHADAKYIHLSNEVIELTARAEKAERERDDFARRSVLTTSNLIADMRTKAEQRAESAEHKVAMLDAEVGQAKALAETNAKLRDVWARKYEAANAKLDELQTAAKSFDEKYAWLLRKREADQKELADAREQLAKVEWAGQIREGQQLGNGCRAYLAKSCPECFQVQPSEVAKKHFTPDQIGHRPTCWYARQGKTKNVGEVRIRNHRKSCPARTAEDVAWVDSRWDNARGHHEKPILGERPRPIGCDGCECAKGIDAVKRGHAARCNDLIKSGRLVIGCDFGFKPILTYMTIQDLVSSKEIGKSALLDLLGIPSSKEEPSRPVPKFKVGQKVELGGATWIVLTVHGDGNYTINNDGRWVYAHENDLKPAPRFAVGEWVTLTGFGGGLAAEVTSFGFRKEFHEWRYELKRADGRLVSTWREGDIEAQTPQYKHDCSGCVFLGRYAAFDLHWHNGGAVYRYGVHIHDAGSKQDSEAGREARRRAVARGLVKG